MNRATTTRTRWTAAPVVYQPRLRCPKCGAPDLPGARHGYVRGVGNQGDESSATKRRCRECNSPFLVVVE